MSIDPGNTLATALNLGNQSGSVNRTVLNFVGDTDLDDYLRFSLSSSSSLTLSLTNLQADANLGLYDSTGQLLQSSVNTGNANEAIATQLAAGDYYLRVSALGGAITDYTLGIQGVGANPPEPGSTLSGALDLGGHNYATLTQLGSVNSLNDPSDLYQFELNATSAVNLLLTGLTTDADVAILNSLGAVIAGSDRGGMADDGIATTLATGIYYIQITPFDAGLIDYRLNLDIALDDNAGNTLATARKLNGPTTTLSGTQVFNDLVSGAGTNSPDPNDFYRLTLLTRTDYSMGLTGLSADVDVRLVQDLNNNGVMDAGEVLTASTQTGTTAESITGALNAGTYWLQVYSHSIAASPYRLTVTATPQDGAGNSSLSAREVGPLVGDREFNDFVGTVDLDDFYRFILPSTSDFQLNLTDLQADADVRLLDGAGNIITVAAAGGTTSEVITRQLAAGTYFVQVSPVLNSNSNYRLALAASPVDDGAGNRLETARNVGSLTSSVSFNDFVGVTDLNDIYRFNLEATSNFTLSLSGLTADADVVLVQDTNSNGQLDAGEIIASSTLASASPETINQVLAAGTYYAWVYSYRGNTGYNLSLEAAPVGDNILDTATNLGELTTALTRTDFVGTTDTVDFYRFTLSRDRTVGTFLSGLSADADVQLIQDLNNNGVVDVGEVLGRSIRAGAASEAIFTNLAAGTYFVQVYPYSGNTNYTLELVPSGDGAGSTLDTAANLGVVTGMRTVNDVIGEIDPTDFYRFSVNTFSSLSLSLNGLDAVANMQLIQDLNSNGLVDAGEVMAATTRRVGDFGPSELLAALNPGTYFVRILPFESQNTRYDLTLTANGLIADGAGNTLAVARNVGALSNTPVTFRDFVGTDDPNDDYQFTLTENSTLNLFLNGLVADADVQLIRDANNNGIVDAGEVLGLSQRAGSNTEAISLLLGTGTYFVRVYSFRGTNNTFYNLSLSASSTGSAFNSQSGYGLVNAGAAVARAIGESTPFADQPNFGDANHWGVNLVNAPEVWARNYTGQGITVAVIDSGVDYTHPDLDGNIWINAREIPGNGRDDDGNGFIDDVRGWDFIDRDNNPLDGNGHGTHVAGTIAAENNGLGITGVAYNARIMPIRVLDDNGSGSNSSVAQGILYAANNGAHVINLSLGGGFSQAIVDAIQFAVSRGVVVVMAAGNESSSQPGFPARYADQFGIAVGAVDIDRVMADFSNRAGNVQLNYVVAPGVGVYSTTPNNTFRVLNGTSMATPHVAGVVALMLSANPGLTPAQVASILAATSSTSAVIV